MIIGMVMMGITASLIDSIYPLFNQYALNHFVAGKTLDTMGWFILLFLAILVFQVIINFISVYWAGKIEMSVDVICAVLLSIICRNYPLRISTRTMSAMFMPES
jgi:ABC-type bacteriocin/lantibiotic exporter with double-glycine peptidase domain